MIYSHGRRYLFVHIPKTGGTSLALALEARAMKDDLMLGDTPKASKRRHKLKGIKTTGRLWKHARLSDLGGLVKEEDLQDTLIFTMVRNPWDRVVSYYYWLQSQKFGHPAVVLAKRLQFPDFLDQPLIQGSFRNDYAGLYVTDWHGREHPATFVRLEHFEADIAPVEAHLGFRLAPLPHVNQSARDNDYRAYYTDRMAECVAEICAADIARFSYQF